MLYYDKYSSGQGFHQSDSLSRLLTSQFLRRPLRLEQTVFPPILSLRARCADDILRRRNLILWTMLRVRSDAASEQGVITPGCGAARAASEIYDRCMLNEEGGLWRRQSGLSLVHYSVKQYHVSKVRSCDFINISLYHPRL